MLVLSVRLLENGRQFVVKFWEVQSYMWIFHCMGVGTPTPALFKGSCNEISDIVISVVSKSGKRGNYGIVR